MRPSNDARQHLTALLTGFALVAAGLTAALLDSGPAWAPLAAYPLAPPPDCLQSEDLVWAGENGATIDLAATTLLATNGMLIACPWTPGTLAVTLRGTLGGGIGTRVVIVQGAERLLDIELRDEARAFEVDVPANGQLLLAFVNDFYDPPEDRNLWVSGLEFTPRAP